MRTRHVIVGVVATVSVAAASVGALAAHGKDSGSTSSQSPYVVPSTDGVETKAIFTVGDVVGDDVKDGYRMTGIPDGLGAFKAKDGAFTLLMNHEISSGGGTRAHGATGSFVSQWTIDRDKGLSVREGSDLIREIATWNSGTGSYDAATAGVILSRLCSADLPAESAFWDRKSKTGYDGRLFTNGEENGTTGRAFAHTLDGTSYELPAIGKYSHENVVANPAAGRKTVVVSTDDSTPGQVYVYVGEKRTSGNPAERAGLTGGTLYGIKVPGVPVEPAGGIASGTTFTAASLGDVSSLTGAALETASDAAGVTEWNRPEDGAWDPKHPNDFYFVITASFGGNSKLYRLHFKDPADPLKGGTVDQLLTGTEDGGTGERFHMLDNIAVDEHGHVVLQEDPGGQDYLARIWVYGIKSGSLTEVAHFDPARFSPDSITMLTNDEESSGVIDAEEILGRGWFLFDAQAHYGISNYLVEGGQLLALKIPGNLDR